MASNHSDVNTATVGTSPRPAIKVFVATTVMLSFISFWRAAAIVLSDLASSAYYVAGDAEKVIGKSAPWFVLAVMLFANGVRAIYIESSAMFVRGGVYRVVKKAMGGTLAKLSVSALLFDYVLTGPISSVSAGQYLAGLIDSVSAHLGHHIVLTGTPAGDYFAAAFGVLVVAYFWWKNIQGMHESSTKALRIMQVATVMVIMLIVWCCITLIAKPANPVPLPSAQTILEASKHTHGETLGWLQHFPFLASLPFVLMVVGFGHSVLAMSGEESLAQVNREIEHPKLKNLKKAAVVIAMFSLFFTSLVSFFAVMIIPDDVRPQYFANLISGLAMYMVGPYNLKLVFQAFVVVVGVLILSGAANTAIVGANGVINRIIEDGVLTDWFRKPHGKYGTSHRVINMIALLQAATVIGTRGNVYLLAALYAFGVVWSFSFMSLAVLVLRFTEPGHRDFRVPGNIRIGNTEIPIGLALISLLLFSTAVVNLFTKPLATVGGISFSLFLFILFTFSERHTLRQRGEKHELHEEFRVAEQPLVNREEMKVRPGNILVTIRDPRNLYYLKKVLEDTDTNRQDVVVMTARIYHRDPSFSGTGQFSTGELFNAYEQELFTKVVALAEKAGKHVSLMVVPTTNVFDGIMQAAQRLEASKVVCGLSNKLTSDQQAKYTGDAWERLPQPRPNLVFEVNSPETGPVEYFLGPHTPRLRQKDLDLLHSLWLEVSSDPEFSCLHHYHIVGLALERLKDRLNGAQREDLLAALRNELQKEAKDKKSS
jgi:amino acid transporter